MDATLEHLTFLDSDLLDLLGVIHKNLDAELQSELVEVEIEAGDFGVLDDGGHVLVCLDCLDGIALDELALGAALSVGLEDVDGLDVVLGLAEEALLLDVLDGIHDQLAEELWVGVDELAAHGGLGRVEQSLLAQLVDAHCQFVLNVAACLLRCDLEARDNAGGVHLHLDQLVSPLQQLSSQDHHGGCSVADLSILQLRKLDQKIGGGVLDFQFFEDGGAWVRVGVPSLVMVTSPISSTIILSSPCGPNEERTMFATERAARTNLDYAYRCRRARPSLIPDVLRYSLLLTLIII